MSRPRRDELNKKIVGLASEAFSSAYKEAIASGSPVVVARSGRLYKMMPDGSREVLKELPEMIAVQKSRVLAL